MKQSTKARRRDTPIMNHDGAYVELVERLPDPGPTYDGKFIFYNSKLHVCIYNRGYKWYYVTMTVIEPE